MGAAKVMNRNTLWGMSSACVRAVFLSTVDNLARFKRGVDKHC